ncbi:MAG: TlpA family protein disulfide reductase [Eubacterium sp.]|nr:TlpA family protein disulfide reductase [Eubacterium sp.]
MKNKIILITISIVLVIIATLLVIIFSPKKFFGNVDSYDVTNVIVYDGETGKEFNINQADNIQFIVDNLKGIKAYRSKLGVGSSAEGLKVSLKTDDTLLGEVIITGSDSLRDNLFVYKTDNFICYDYIKDIEEDTNKKVDSTERVDVDKSEAEPHPLVEGELAPDFTAELSGGKTFKLSDYDNKVVIVNFWATWCGPCVGEMPAFEKLKNDGYDKLEIVCINCAEDKSTVDEFVKEMKYTFNIACDVDGKIEKYYPTDGIPYTLIIANGRIKNIFLGADEADAQYKVYKKAVEDCISEIEFEADAASSAGDAIGTDTTE